LNTQQDHNRLIEERGLFIISCSTTIFSKEELDILNKYGHWFQALTTGELTPISEAQKRFVSVAKNEAEPLSIHEKAWFKYLGRMRLEKENGSSFNLHYQPEIDSFYNRDMVKQVRRQVFSETVKNHKL
jgi:uncharacterized protein YifE (UPF0438 family)